MTSALLRDDPDAFEALRDTTSERLGVDPGAVEKDYWATEVLRSATSTNHGVDGAVFKGGTSLSKAYKLIERFSEDIDLLVVTQQTGNRLKRTLRSIADRVTRDLGVGHDREREGKGYLNARFEYPAVRSAPFLSSGALLEMGSRGGPTPNERLPVRSLMSEASQVIDPSAEADYIDLRAFEVTVLAPERTLAEKFAFLHHRATIGDLDGLRKGARHLYDVALLLRSPVVRAALAGGRLVELMEDVDARSETVGWGYTPRPRDGFAASPAFAASEEVTEALFTGFVDLAELAWGDMPTVEEAVAEVHANATLL